MKAGTGSRFEIGRATEKEAGTVAGARKDHTEEGIKKSGTGRNPIVTPSGCNLLKTLTLVVHRRVGTQSPPGIFVLPGEPKFPLQPEASLRLPGTRVVIHTDEIARESERLAPHRPRAAAPRKSEGQQHPRAERTAAAAAVVPVAAAGSPLR